MSTRTSALTLDPNDPRLTRDIQNIHIPGPPRTAFAKKILELSNDSARAERVDHCGRYSNRRDINNHKKRQVQRCSRGFCIGCAIHRADSTLKRWESMIEMIIATADTLEDGKSPHIATYIEAHIPRPKRDRDDADKLLEDLEDTLFDQLLIQRSLGMRGHFTAMAGYLKNSAILRLLILNTDLAQQEWAAMFPSNATVKIIEEPLCELPRLFKKLLSADFLMDLTSEDRAEQDVLLSGMRRFRAHGIHMGASDGDSENDLFASTDIPPTREAIPPSSEVLANNSSAPTASADRHNHDICPICGEPYIEQSQWFEAGTPEPRQEDYRWTPIRH